MASALQRHVLVVDDDAAMRDSLREILEQEGLTVVLAKNGQEALATVRARRDVNLVLLDIMMPVMNGFEFLAAKMRDPSISSIPVLIMSAHLTTVSQVPGPKAIFSKPFNPAALLEKISELC